MLVASRLTLAIRTALLLAAASTTAWAADEPLTLGETNVNAVYNGPTDLPDVLAGGQVARGARLGMLGNKDVMDTPFSVTSYTAKTLADLQTVTVADALERDPSVRSTGQTGGIVDSFFIRGFAIGEGNLGELAYDGVY
ncbi:TonB-dependent receptor plug domain-containing protein, partial [Klebsiella pneumoniae]